MISVAYHAPELPRPLRLLARRPGLCWALALAVYLPPSSPCNRLPFIVANDTDPQFLATHLAHGALATLLVIPVVFGDPNARAAATDAGQPA